MTPSTPSGRRLADWLDAMRRKQYLGVPMPSEVDAIEAEAGREAVEAYRLDTGLDADDLESIALMLKEFPTWFPELEAKIARLHLIEGDKP